MLTHFQTAISPPRKLERARQVTPGNLAYLPKISVDERASRAEAVRQANASIALEGFTVDPQVAEWDQQYIDGKLTLDEKLILIKDLYAHG